MSINLSNWQFWFLKWNEIFFNNFFDPRNVGHVVVYAGRCCRSLTSSLSNQESLWIKGNWICGWTWNWTSLLNWMSTQRRMKEEEMEFFQRHTELVEDKSSRMNESGPASKRTARTSLVAISIRPELTEKKSEGAADKIGLTPWMLEARQKTILSMLDQANVSSLWKYDHQ